jgi:hypothetical protein
MSTPSRRLHFSSTTEAELVSLTRRSKAGEYARDCSISELKTVYYRGAASSKGSDSLSIHEAAMTRVIDHLKARSVADVDLQGITAGAVSAGTNITIQDESFYATPEHAIFAITAYAGLGFEVISAFRASWLRAVRENDNPFERTRSLAVDLYSAHDADLLPKKGK